jgi:hypothetical protein
MVIEIIVNSYRSKMGLRETRAHDMLGTRFRGTGMADLIDDPCPVCHRKSVEVEFRYQHPWRRVLVWAMALLVALGIGQLISRLVKLPHQTLLPLSMFVGVSISNILGNFMEPRVAKRTAYFRCRLCGDTSTRVAIHGLGMPSKV